MCKHYNLALEIIYEKSQRLINSSSKTTENQRETQDKQLFYNFYGAGL